MTIPLLSFLFWLWLLVGFLSWTIETIRYERWGHAASCYRTALLVTACGPCYWLVYLVGLTMEQKED